MKTFKLIVLATLLAAAPACKKTKPEDKPAPTATVDAAAMADPGSNTMGSADPGSAGSAGSGSADPGSAAAATEELPAEYIIVEGTHKDPNPKDPVKVHFEKFKVTKATFDPAKI
ncbi:MAG TPA: hypothetical protein VIU61_26480, partial [Kofleriaceae bacterium]